MRKKKETPSAKRGRPRNNGLVVPTWAIKAIQGLSDHSGVMSQKIFELALRSGLYVVGEPLGSWIRYQESAEKLWNEHITNPKADNGKEPRPTIDDVVRDELGDEPTGPEDFEFERGQLPEVPDDNEVIQALNGE